jgi:uncharacterized repeat protein (TIGR01451 family)
MMKKLYKFLILAGVIAASLALPAQSFAQDEGEDPIGLQITTPYPNQVAELGKTVNIDLDIRALEAAQTVELEMEELPEGWEAAFRGGGQIIKSVYVEANNAASVDLLLTPPEGANPGDLKFVISGKSDKADAELELALTIAEKVPASLTFETDLPTINGAPDTTFRYNTTLENNSDQELTINLSADAPAQFLTSFSVSGHEVTSFPLGAQSSKSMTVELEPISEIAAGEYPITVYASGGDLQAKLELTASVTGQQNLHVTGLDGRLSGDATAGEKTTLQILIQNNGTAPAQGVSMSSSAPSGWEVTFDPETIDQILDGESVEVTASITPPEEAVAGDYMVTVRAKPAQGATEIAEFRITVKTSTLWGIVGVGLIAVAVAVVGFAVMRFGRR